ncbi:hypothetical protein [Bacillus sp. NEB1478]|uniref:hypothetical protein n=1 Tax=Bacillus sp. NEB1478 TaxID=3073816 RepID=UPI00287317AE|nr:hypothetical protein [Bacillus sp. NEB1478]WNB91748.1 hypothetical protein RGB74_18010 [Bacillus sp. NEB1478]
MDQTQIQQGAKPFIGDMFPQMHVQTTLGELVLPTSYQGHWFVLFSHPGDFYTCLYNRICRFSKINAGI